MSRMIRDVYIVDCVRTPLGRGKKNGMLASCRPVDLLAECLKEVAKRAGVDPSCIEDVVSGCVIPVNQQAGNIARLAVLKAGFPTTVPGVTLDRACGSAQQAVHFISQGIACGDLDIGIGCGIEMMSVNPMGSSTNVQSQLALMKDFPYKLVSQHYSAENVGKKYNVTRDDCDLFAYKSHEKAGIATQKGFYKKQMVPMKVKNKVLDYDEGIRYPPNMAQIKKLKSLFAENGVVSAGTASQITDGASAILLASAEAIKKYGLKPRAKILSKVVVGSDPILMLDGVIPATVKAVKRAGLKLDDIDLFEINEAFAVVPLAWQKTLNVDWNKVNICGGACAHGHPLGATGCILMTKLVYDLERTNQKYGLQTMCIGNGMATATVIERVTNDMRSKL